MKIKTKLLVQNFHKHVHFHSSQINFASSPSDVELNIQVEGITIVGKEMKFLVKFMTSVIVAIASVADAAGNAIDAALIGAVTWASSDESIATVGPNEAGQIVVTPTGKAGTVQISVTGDSDPTTPEGFVGLVELTFLPGEAAVVNLTVETSDNISQVA